MADFTSQGLSSALEDAVVLGDALDDSTAPLARRLADFVATRRPEVAKVMAAGRDDARRLLRMATATRDASAAALRPFTRSGTTVTKEEIAAMVYDTLDDGLATPVALERDGRAATALRHGRPRRRVGRRRRHRLGGRGGRGGSQGARDPPHGQAEALRGGAAVLVVAEHPRGGRSSGTGVRLDVLKRRAFNYRWATVPEGVLPLTAASSDYPAPPAVVAALQAHVEDATFPTAPTRASRSSRGGGAYFSDRVARGAAAVATRPR